MFITTVLFHFCNCFAYRYMENWLITLDNFKWICLCFTNKMREYKTMCMWKALNGISDCVSVWKNLCKDNKTNQLVKDSENISIKKNYQNEMATDTNIGICSRKKTNHSVLQNWEENCVWKGSNQRGVPIRWLAVLRYRLLYNSKM